MLSGLRSAGEPSCSHICRGRQREVGGLHGAAWCRTGSARPRRLQVHAFLPASSAPSLAGRGAGSDLVVGAPVDSAAAGAASRDPDGAAAPREYADPLHEELYACTEVAEVLDIVEDEASTGLSARHVCKLLVRAAALARRRDGGGPEEQRALVEHPMFALLLTLAEECAASFSAKEVAQVLHALATLRQRPVPLLQALSAEAAGKAPGANAQDVATGIWALGTLRYLSRTALEAYTARMLELLPTFDPQGLSMIAYGFAQLEHAPDGDALERLCDAAAARLPEFRSQATSNLLYALARLQHYPHGLCAAAEEHAAACIVGYRPQELSNLLWAFVKFRHSPRRLLAALEARVGDAAVAARMQSSNWAVLVWAAATMGVELQAATYAALPGGDALGAFSAAEQCNVLWGLALLGRTEMPQFRALLAALTGAHARRTLEPRLQRQLHQAVQHAHAAGTVGADALPPELARSAAKWWSKAAVTVPSLSLQRVARLVKELGVPYGALQQVADRTVIVDIAIQREDGRPVALQVVGPHETARSGELLGGPRAAARLLSAHGWDVLYLQVGQLPAGLPHRQQLRRLETLLRQNGVLAAGAASRRKAAPADGARL